MDRKPIKAALPKEDRYNQAINHSGEKEEIRQMLVVGRPFGKMKVLLDVRWYRGRSKSASTVYCSFWLSRPDRNVYRLTGSGRAGGCGYDKPSAAFNDAIRNSGAKLSWPFAGVGSSASEEAALALVRATGYRGQTLII